MARQLVLITPDEADWQLDERTRELGRRGISQARAALRRALPVDGLCLAVTTAGQPETVRTRVSR